MWSGSRVASRTVRRVKKNSAMLHFAASNVLAQHDFRPVHPLRFAARLPHHDG